MHGPDVEKMVLRLWDSGRYNKADIVKYFQHQYKGGYYIAHSSVSLIIKRRNELMEKHASNNEMTNIALGVTVVEPSPKKEHHSGPAYSSGAFFVDEQVGGAHEESPLIKDTIESENKNKLRGYGSVVLAIPDLHCPFEHPDSLAFLKLVRDTYKPNKVVCLGDEIDAHAFSKYPKDPDGLSAGKELKEAIEHLEAFYIQFPEVLVCESNHTIRPWKKAFEAGLPKSFLRAVETVLNAPDGWKWASKHVVDGVVYMHGDSGCSGFTAHIQYMRKLKQSCVIGHIHSYAGVNYEGPLFGMNAGCLIDTDAYCFKYAKGLPIPVSLGCGIVQNGAQAHFIPMRVDDDGRWIGTI
jgi:hypothetical protein